MISFLKKILNFLGIKRSNDRSFILHLIVSRNRIINNKDLIGCEIGVYKGTYSNQILNHFQKKGFSLQLSLIDPWKINDDYKEYGEKILEDAYHEVVSKFKNIKNVEILREDSLSASKRFKNSSLDFVYVDGNHDYEFVLKDLETWFTKVKPGGIIFGDDYLRPYGVTKAVNEFSFKHKITPCFSDYGNQYFFIKE